MPRKPAPARGIKFDATSHDQPGKFHVPQRHLDSIGCNVGDTCYFEIHDRETGALIFSGELRIKAGPTVSGGDLHALKPKQDISVLVEAT